MSQQVWDNYGSSDEDSNNNGNKTLRIIVVLIDDYGLGCLTDSIPFFNHFSSPFHPIFNEILGKIRSQSHRAEVLALLTFSLFTYLQAGILSH